MKIIDLLNIWVEDRNKLPKKIKVDDKIYVYDEQTNLYKIPGKNYFLISDYLDCIEKIYANNVEVIEENKEIEIQKIKPFIIPQTAESKEKDMWTDRIMINKLIESVKQLDNKLNKERKEK